MKSGAPKSPRLAALVAALGVLLAAHLSLARPHDLPQLASEPAEPGLVGDIEGTLPQPSKVAQDTVWIADWSLDGAGCTEAGWLKYDNRIRNDGSNYWSINTDHAGTGGISNNAAVLAKHDLSWARDGYGNDWDYSIILEYQGASTLSFSYLSDSESGFDFVTVESDSAGVSEALVNYAVDPQGTSSAFRTVLMSVSGVQNAAAGPIALSDYGVPGTVHEVYIRFASDGGYSDEDGLYPTQWNAGLVVDNIAVTGTLNYSENFEGALNANVTLANTATSTPFGEWARAYLHISDNDKCTENTTCAWLVTDPLRTAFFPDMAFGPGSAVIRNWLDDIVVTPWVSLASTPSTTRTLISYRRFPGNDFAQGRIVQNWSVRSLVKLDNTDTSTLGDSITVMSPWGHASSWNSLTLFAWGTSIGDMSFFVEPSALEIQLRWRHSDWQWIAGSGAPATQNPGPGPYSDRLRIGRHVLSGPVINPGIDTRSQAQDCFPTFRNSILHGEHFSPTTDIFGTCAFSMGSDLGIGATSFNLITGDSIWVEAKDVRGAGGVTQVRWYGAITRGPHAGKAPSPWTTGANGFFEVTPDSARGSGGSIIVDRYFVDLDDTYFRGGDVLLYFWTATDAGGGRASFPGGITAANFPPASPQAAELVTRGLCEASFLPTNNWSPSYLARIAADAHGDLDPTPAEIAASPQATCVLYYNGGVSTNRRSGDLNRTSFMYTLDRLGYRGYYDVYDHQGYGNTNNQLGGRATLPQCDGYALIIHDGGRGLPPNIPDGIELDAEKVDQCQWYRDYLAQGITSSVGVANLWLVGEDNAFEKQTNPLLSTDLGLTSVLNNQALNVNPNVTGQGSFTFSNGNVASFAGEVFSLNGGCPTFRDYDGASSTGTAVVTHSYTFGATTGTGAVVMNKNTVLHWNTIWMGFGWFDIRDPSGTSPASGAGAPDTRLARKILNAVLPVGCVQGENPTGVPGPETEAAPAVTMLHPNVPNPFNPTTSIRFDLAHDGRVRLQIFDAAGRLVKTLVDGKMARGFAKTVTWNGHDESGRRVPSGVYFYKLVTDDAAATKKMVMLK